MFIIWGTRSSVKSYGHAADWCPRCGSVRPVTLLSMGTRGHVYYIPLPCRRDLSGSTAVCSFCRHAWNVDLSTYAARSATPIFDLNELVRTTHPDLVTKAGRQLTLEQRLLTGALTSEDRHELMTRRVLALGSGVAIRLQTTHLDRLSWLVLGVMVSLLTIGIVCKANGQKDAGNACMALAGTSFVALVIVLATDCGRYYRRHLLPKLVDYAGEIGLRPEEWPPVRAALRRMNVPIGRATSARDMDALRNLPVGRE